MGNDKNNSIRKVLHNEIAQLIAIVIVVYTFITMVILPIQRMQQEIDTIKNNELVHVQAALKDQAELNSKQDDKINEIDKKLERVITILESQQK
jgi:hypothetical protein